MTAQGTPIGNHVISKVFRPLDQAAGWMKLIGTVNIIYGVLMALTIIGIIVAWLPIWLGILTRKAAVEAQVAYASGDEVAAVASTDSLRTLFKIQGIITLIYLIIWVFLIIILLVGIIAAVSSS
jgi:hypothetical protein